jgi:phosphotransferase system HPr-like phosphotransfer protein
MGVLMLVASMGSVIIIRTHGAQAREAGEALAKLVGERFGEDK